MKAPPFWYEGLIVILLGRMTPVAGAGRMPVSSDVRQTCRSLVPFSGVHHSSP